MLERMQTSNSHRDRSAGRTALGLGAMLAAVALLALGLGHPSSRAAEQVRPIPAPKVEEAPPTTAIATAVLAGGCFWGVQGVFQHVDGVGNAVSGYAGGDAASATYRIVGGGRSGHAEAVEISYDPLKISYGRLLQIFFSVAHDPTEIDRQGPDVGPQYRSAIFPTSPEQARVAKAYIAELDAAGVFAKPIATRIEPGATFYRAEDYHQDFMARHPTHPYIVFHDLPKREALKRAFPELYRAEPTLVAAATN